MRKSARVALSVFAMSVFVISGVMAGIEPSPFQPQINQLNASENILSSIEQVVTITIENPPIEGQPSPNLTGALNKLEATDVRVTSVSGFITSIYEEVMGTEPSPFRADIVPALEYVKMAAEDIVNAIARYAPPAGVPQQFIDALGAVGFSAQGIVDDVQLYIEILTGTPPIDCAGIHDEVTCNDTGGACVWYTDDTGIAECRDAI
jgi:hypothetical protein